MEGAGPPELVGGVKGAPGRPSPPKGPCSMDLLHWASMSSFMSKAAGSRGPVAPGNKGCLKGPASPGKLGGAAPDTAAAAAAAVPVKNKREKMGYCRFSSV